MRVRLWTVILGTLLWPGVFGVAAGVEDRPNLLVLIGDDHAAYALGVDGDNHGATPNLDRLARRSAWFSRAYCVAPVCTASRQAFLTGRYAHAVGVTQLPTALSESEITLAEWLADRGYATAAIGKMHFNSSLTHGFDALIDTPQWRGRLAEEARRGKTEPPARPPWRPFATPAAQWLNAANRSTGLSLEDEEAPFFAARARDFLRRNRHKPFALVVSFHEPHSPFVFPRDWEGTYKPEQFPVRETTDADLAGQPEIFATLTPDQKRGIQAAYYTSLKYMDSQIGRVLDELRRLELDRDTIVVYFGDNGYSLGHHGRFEKHVLTEPGVRVPLIVSWPGRVVPRRIDDLVELVDLVPTVLDLMGLPTHEGVQGRSLAALLRDEPGAAGRVYAFSEYLENEEAMIRDDRYKLIVGTGARERQDGYRTGRPLPGPFERLYDLVADPDERINLADRGELREIQSRLQTELHRILTTTRRPDDAVPEGLSEIEAIRWCLVPRDVKPPEKQK